MGLKIFKEFGLTIKNANGSLLAIDDERLDPIWDACAELNMPVLIHTADPAAFFEPIDQYNERWAELQNYPDWSFAELQPIREEALGNQRAGFQFAVQNLVPDLLIGLFGDRYQ